MKDWDDLRYFHAVAEGGSLSAASRRLSVNHSTVFRRINQLEQRLAVKLFDRHDNRYLLTEAGEQLHAKAQGLAAIIDDIDRNVAGRDTLMEGRIRLTCPESFAEAVLPPLIRQFQAQYPGVTVELLVGQEDFDLSRRQADIALRATNKPPEHLVGQQVGSVPWHFFGRRRFARNTPAMLPDRDATELPLIAPSGALLRVPACQWLEKHRARFHVVASANALPAMAALARAGIGIALLPEEVAAGLQRIATPARELSSARWLLIHPDMRHNLRIQTFMRFLRERLA